MLVLKSIKIPRDIKSVWFGYAWSDSLRKSKFLCQVFSQFQLTWWGEKNLVTPKAAVSRDFLIPSLNEFLTNLLFSSTWSILKSRGVGGGNIYSHRYLYEINT